MAWRKWEMSLFKWCSHLFNMLHNNMTQDFEDFLPYPLLLILLPPGLPMTALRCLRVIACAAIPKPSNCVWLLALKWNLIYSQTPFYRAVKKEAHGFWRGHAAPTWPSPIFAVRCYSCRHFGSPLWVQGSPIWEENSENVNVTCKAFRTICMARFLCAICVALFPHSCFKIDLHVPVVNYDYW